MYLLYLNPETGPSATEDAAMRCISRTRTAYISFKNQVSELYQGEGEDAFSFMQFYSNNGQAKYFSELTPKLDNTTKVMAQVFLNHLSKGSTVPSLTAPTTLMLKDINQPSPYLEHVLNQNGLTLSFASSACWEKDFIEFVDCQNSIPNIWGQTTFTSFNGWLKQQQTTIDIILNQMQTKFNVEFCGDKSKKSFNMWEWRVIYDAFEKSHNLGFQANGGLIKPWGDLPIFYIRDRSQSAFILRIFFIKKGEKIYVGEIYHKNGTNTRKEENAANQSYKIFKTWGLI
ncbi:MAG: hypothetical protein ACRCTY_07495 [Candidatus Adiutrix sp.]